MRVRQGTPEHRTAWTPDGLAGPPVRDRVHIFRRPNAMQCQYRREAVGMRRAGPDLERLGRAGLAGWLPERFPEDTAVHPGRHRNPEQCQDGRRKVDTASRSGTSTSVALRDSSNLPLI